MNLLVVKYRNKSMSSLKEVNPPPYGTWRRPSGDLQVSQKRLEMQTLARELFSWPTHPDRRGVGSAFPVDNAFWKEGCVAKARA